ncbi:MAG TPA: LysR family transcriptional regulator [Stellaceae bacterium]|jgi:DNA-binding transcriptional LysR family regulator|nr:LysR family transcriptional regulator [Stellaceae bacterium]
MARLEEMEAFLRTAEASSFTAAAERLGLSKSVISHRVSELEARLGVRLLNRTTRRLSLTEAGTVFLERCQRILSDLDEAEDLVINQGKALRGVIHLAAPLSFSFQHLQPAVLDFMADNPEVEISLDLDDRIVDLIGGGFDMAIRIGNLADSSLTAKRLAPSRLAVCCSPDYAAHHPLPQHPDELVEHECLLYSGRVNGRTDVWDFRDGAKDLSVRVGGNLSANNGEMLMAAAIRGYGLTLLPTFIVGPALEDGRLIRVLPEWPLVEGAIYAVYPSNRHVTGRVRAFTDFLASRIGREPYWDKALMEKCKEAEGRP